MNAPLTHDGWLTSPLFARIDGHPAKRYTAPNTGALGIACHSIVGEEPDDQDGIPGRFLSDEREPDDPSRFTARAAASVMFILRKHMQHVQMYDVETSTWTSGGREANTQTWAIEAEGGGPGNEREPLTRHQEDGFIEIARAWQWKHSGLPGLWQHKDLARKFGYEPTACASDRYANAWARLMGTDQQQEQEQPMPEITEERIREIAEAAAGSVFLPLMEQLLDLQPETFTDDKTLAAIRRAMAGQRAGHFETIHTVAEALGRIADGAVEAHALLAGLAEGAE